MQDHIMFLACLWHFMSLQPCGGPVTKVICSCCFQSCMILKTQKTMLQSFAETRGA